MRPALAFQPSPAASPPSLLLQFTPDFPLCCTRFFPPSNPQAGRSSLAKWAGEFGNGGSKETFLRPQGLGGQGSGGRRPREEVRFQMGIHENGWAGRSKRRQVLGDLGLTVPKPTAEPGLQPPTPTPGQRTLGRPGARVGPGRGRGGAGRPLALWRPPWGWRQTRAPRLVLSTPSSVSLQLPSSSPLALNSSPTADPSVPPPPAPSVPSSRFSPARRVGS